MRRMTEASELAKDQRTGRNVELQHRHFSFIASVISAYDPNDRRKVAEHFGEALLLTNKRFDYARFIKACGLEVMAIG